MKRYKDSCMSRDVISLFSGALGLDLGLERAGLTVKIGQEIDSSCIATMKTNNHPVLGGDIQNIIPQEILMASGLSQGQAFLVCGGPPCQPFSTAGKRLGVNDPRGSLFMDFIRMIDFIKPRFFLMENVKGLVSAPLQHIPHADRDLKKLLPEQQLGSVLEIILDEFNKLGYKTVHGVLDAVNYGVPQFRERFIIIGSRDNEDVFLPIPTHFQLHQNVGNRWLVLKDVIFDIENEIGECAAFSHERLSYLKTIPEGGNWRNLPAEVVEKAMGGAYKSGGGKVGFFRRLSYNQPSPTLLTSPVQKASMLCHPTQDRPLSVREYARIQQFPDNFIFTGNTSAKYRQIGNAVPVGLGEALGRAILSVADESAYIYTKRTRGTNVHNRIKNALKMEKISNAN